VSDSVEGLTEIKGYDYYVWVSREQVSDFVEKSYDSCCGRTRRSKGKLVMKGKRCWRLMKTRVDEIMYNSSLHNSCKDRCD